MPRVRSSKRTRKALLCDYLSYSSNSIFGYTEPGAGKKKFECQDTYSIIDIPEDHLKYYAVYDGHGNVGRQVGQTFSHLNLGFSLSERLRG